jgi:hypothetical protein
MSSEGQVNLAGDLARVFFHQVALKSIVLADTRVKALTERAEKAEAIVAQFVVSGYAKCVTCNVVSKYVNGGMVAVSEECGCRRGNTPAWSCYTCINAESLNRHTSCTFCSYSHSICTVHAERIPCDFEGCKGALRGPVCITDFHKCDTCGLRICGEHHAKHTSATRCTTCEDELKAFHASLKAKRKQLRKRKKPTK